MDDEKRISLRLPTNLHARLVEEARSDRRSLNSEIIHLLEGALGPAGRDAPTPPTPVEDLVVGGLQHRRKGTHHDERRRKILLIGALGSPRDLHQAPVDLGITRVPHRAPSPPRLCTAPTLLRHTPTRTGRSNAL